jgi:hypothetical protein
MNAKRELEVRDILMNPDVKFDEIQHKTLMAFIVNKDRDESVDKFEEVLNNEYVSIYQEMLLNRINTDLTYLSLTSTTTLLLYLLYWKKFKFPLRSKLVGLVNLGIAGSAHFLAIKTWKVGTESVSYHGEPKIKVYSVSENKEEEFLRQRFISTKRPKPSSS